MIPYSWGRLQRLWLIERRVYMYTTIVIIFSIIVLIQFWYIIRIRHALEYAVKVLEKYKVALLMNDIVGEIENESKTD